MSVIPSWASAPLVMHSETTVQPNSDAEFSAGPLTNSTGEAVYIYEVKFSIRPTDKVIASSTGSGKLVSGGQFAISMAIKDQDDFGYSLTNNPVPIWSLGSPHNLKEEIININLQSVGSADRLSALAHNHWKPDHPIYMPPGARFVPTVRSLGAFGSEAIVGISLVCGVTPSAPMKDRYKLPWVGAYLSSSFEYNATGSDSSADNLLANPHNKNVFVERFVGRIHCLNEVLLNGVTFQSLRDDAGDASSVGVSGNNWYSRAFRVKMQDSAGNVLVRRSTLFRNVFCSSTRTWECKTVLPPQQYFNVDVEKSVLPTMTQTIGRSTRAQVSVAMIGWREVSWRKE